ncbi:fragmin60 [Schizophyllum fasciatum]
MAHLTKPQTYNIEDTNIALLGSDLEKRVREHAGDAEPAWATADLDQLGTRIWRIEQFQVVEWPQDRYGAFFDGDSYIILHTYKKDPSSDAVAYDLHFWLGKNTSQDEAGTAAYKTVELDDYLHGLPVQYREVQDLESARLLSYFPRFMVLHGGAASGFRHVVDAPPPDVRRLYRIQLFRGEGDSTGAPHLLVREVPAEADLLIAGDAYVLDMGTRVWQLNTRASAGLEKFRAAAFARELVDARGGQSDLTVYDEGGPGAGVFLSEFGEGTTLRAPEEEASSPEPTLYRLSDASGDVTFEQIEPVSASTLHTDDAFLLDCAPEAVFVWIGKGASLRERRLAGQYAQRFLHGHQGSYGHARAGTSIVTMRQGNESEAFLRALDRE